MKFVLLWSVYGQISWFVFNRRTCDVSKIIEKVVEMQLTNHIQEQNLDERIQSAYKKHHSTKTAWVRLHNDILSEPDIIKL